MSSERAKALRAAGVQIPDASQVLVGPEVVLERIAPGAVLHPGARLEGERLLIGPGARIGADGPTRVADCAIGSGVCLGSGSFEGAVFLPGASFGPNGHVREGTLFEEGASAAHAVGTKQTIVLAWGTLGSNINCCDCLLSGGTSERDHSEIGSGFIHFNFTPYGPRGDKATASLFGGVPRGVWGVEPRIFLGGAGGVVGPVHIDFGTVLAAGSVYRKDRGPSKLVYAEALPPREVAFDSLRQRRTRSRFEKNLVYIGHLEALRGFYRAVRRPLAAGDPWLEGVVMAAIDQLNSARRERVKQLGRFLDALGPSLESLAATDSLAGREAEDQRRLFDARSEIGERLEVGLADAELDRDLTSITRALPPRGGDFFAWRSDLSAEERNRGRTALERIVRRVEATSPFAATA